MRLLWAHSCFDRLFNAATSERMRRYGMKVAVGDLVLPRPGADVTKQTLSAAAEAGPRIPELDA